MSGFSEERQAYIRRELLDSGRELFARYGLDKTTIADLTGEVDIAPSTFYRFFDSKERLYLEILEGETERFYERTTTPLAEETDPERAIREHLRVVFEEMETNPLIERVFVGDEFDRLLHRYSGDELAEQRDRELGHLVPYVERWQEAGTVREGDPEAIATTMESPAFLALYRDEIGEKLYPLVRETMIETIAAGLTTTTTPAEDRD